MTMISRFLSLWTPSWIGRLTHDLDLMLSSAPLWLGLVVSKNAKGLLYIRAKGKILYES